MPAPKGNKFYLLAAAPGKEKIITSPQDLWNYAMQYFTWCNDNPWPEQDWVGKDGRAVTKWHPIPYTLGGLASFIGLTKRGLSNYGSAQGYEEYFPIYARVAEIIRTQKLTGAAAGFFNANIIARDLGLVDKTDNEQRISGTVKFIFNEAPGNEPIKDNPDRDVPGNDQEH